MTGDELLPARLRHRLAQAQLGTRRRLLGGLAGDHRSPDRGASLDFADFRDYHPGDDLRRLDTNALARLDRLLVKLYEAEDDLVVRILVDTSGSMAGRKGRRALELAAAVGFVALVRRDVVTLHTFPASGSPPRFRGRGAVNALTDHLAALRFEGDSPFAPAAEGLLTQPGPAGLTVVISDLLTPDWEQAITRLPARRGDFVVLHLLAPEDLDPDLEGDLELVDVESGARVEVSLTASVLEDYRTLARAWADEVAGRVRANGGGYVRTSTTDDLEALLLGRAHDAGVLR